MERRVRERQKCLYVRQLKILIYCRTWTKCSALLCWLNRIEGKVAGHAVHDEKKKPLLYGSKQSKIRNFPADESLLDDAFFDDLRNDPGPLLAEERERAPSPGVEAQAKEAVVDALLHGVELGVDGDKLFHLDLDFAKEEFEGSGQAGGDLVLDAVELSGVGDHFVELDLLLQVVKGVEEDEGQDELGLGEAAGRGGEQKAHHLEGQEVEEEAAQEDVAGEGEGHHLGGQVVEEEGAQDEADLAAERGLGGQVVEEEAAEEGHHLGGEGLAAGLLEGSGVDEDEEDEDRSEGREGLGHAPKGVIRFLVKQVDQLDTAEHLEVLEKKMLKGAAAVSNKTLEEKQNATTESEGSIFPFGPQLPVIDATPEYLTQTRFENETAIDTSVSSSECVCHCQTKRRQSSQTQRNCSCDCATEVEQPRNETKQPLDQQQQQQPIVLSSTTRDEKETNPFPLFAGRMLECPDGRECEVTWVFRESGKELINCHGLAMCHAERCAFKMVHFQKVQLIVCKKKRPDSNSNATIAWAIGSPVAVLLVFGLGATGYAYRMGWLACCCPPRDGSTADQERGILEDNESGGDHPIIRQNRHNRAVVEGDDALAYGSYNEGPNQNAEAPTASQGRFVIEHSAREREMQDMNRANKMETTLSEKTEENNAIIKTPTTTEGPQLPVSGEKKTPVKDKEIVVFFKPDWPDNFENEDNKTQVIFRRRINESDVKNERMKHAGGKRVRMTEFKQVEGGDTAGFGLI